MSKLCTQYLSLRTGVLDLDLRTGLFDLRTGERERRTGVLDLERAGEPDLKHRGEVFIKKNLKKKAQRSMTKLGKSKGPIVRLLLKQCRGKPSRF